jgi:hypothetical protein
LNTATSSQLHVFETSVVAGTVQFRGFSRLTNCQTVPYDLLERGYSNQTCVDFSKVVVDLMKSRHSDKPQVEWRVGDVRNLIDIESRSVDVAFDKGTLDAMIYGSPWSPPDEVVDNSGQYMKEVCLRDADL